MLYISRPITSMQYGVVDTDDDVENIVTFNELAHAVISLNIDIKGVSTVNSSIQGRAIRGIECYQDERYLTGAQAKARMLLGIEIRTFKSEITGIVVHSDIFKDNTVIRLSDFGSSMSGRVAVRWTNIGTSLKNTLIVVLDPKLEMLCEPPSPTMRGVKLDIRELGCNWVVKKIYTTLANKKVPYAGWCSYIIDTEEQRRQWRFETHAVHK